MDSQIKWDKIVKKYPEANFLQSPEYAKMNEILGAKVIAEEFHGKGYALMIVRNAKRGRYLEIPCGPLTNWQDKKAVDEIFQKIIKIASEEKCVFVRIRPQLTADRNNLQILEKHGAKKSPMHLAAEHTVMIDLNSTEEELLAKMRRQTRYEVRRADKLGIKVICDRDKALFEEFQKCQAETAKRQNFVPPSLKTLMAEREAFGDKIIIYKAITDKKEPIAYGLIIKNGLEADYYEAASTLLNRKLPGAYALLWQVMKDLKAEGYQRFNLWGIAPAGQPNHRYAGVTTFKTGFGGEVVEYVPAHDLIISKIKYIKNLTVETMRKKRRHL
ncbi:MAG: peptidoglycan bridge formation glycyltransferase FemA/FemB family protein [Candidatus Saccharibacteria bacterium]|nr:peptidoglycan bridge formation glycyltransferase FemA/FemB family protein [Candidatus Saccharibacteria bacterium]